MQRETSSKCGATYRAAFGNLSVEKRALFRKGWLGIDQEMVHIPADGIVSVGSAVGAGDLDRSQPSGGFRQRLRIAPMSQQCNGGAQRERALAFGDILELFPVEDRQVA